MRSDEVARSDRKVSCDDKKVLVKFTQLSKYVFFLDAVF